MTLGQFIKQYREEHGMSQRTFAKCSGLTNTYISHLENDRNSKGFSPVPSIETYRAVAKVAGITVDELVAIVEDKIQIAPSYTQEEQRMIALFRKASDKDRMIIMRILEDYEEKETSLNSAG